MSAEITELLFVALFGMVLVAFIVAINSRGPVKTAFSYVLATITLIAAVYELVNHFGEARLQQQVKQAQAMEQAQMSRERRGETESYIRSMKSFATRGKRIAGKLKVLNLMDESISMETYFARAASARREANALMNELSGKQPPNDGFAESRKTLKRAINKTLVAAKYLNLYFKSDTENEEEKRAQIFHSNARDASFLFSRVGKLIAKEK